MTREQYHEKMARLERETLELGQTVGSELMAALDAVLRRDMQELEGIIARDRQINRERLTIEGQLIALITTQQPMAVDMRLLASLLEIVGEIERMGDYVKGMARIGVRLGDLGVPPDLAPLLVSMARQCQDMLRQALAAFAERDAETARTIVAMDDAIDELYHEVFRTVLALGAPDAAQLERSNYVLWIAHDLERTADRVTNICERTIYVVTGTLVADARSAMEVRLDAISRGMVDEDEEGTLDH